MASDQNGLQIRILHRKIHRIKEKNFLFYMTLKDRNTLHGATVDILYALLFFSLYHLPIIFFIR